MPEEKDMPETNVERAVIREALPADGAALMEAVGRIDEETEFLGKPGEYRRWREGFAERLAEMRAKRSGIYLMALDGDEIVGFLGAFGGMLRATRGAFYIAHVGLRRAWRGRGLGTRLFVAIEDWARAQGYWRLELRVDELNERGQALYRKQGFVHEGRIAEAALLDGVPRVHHWMAKTLVAFADPAWPSLDPPPGRLDPGAVTFRPLRPDEAALLSRWERRLLGETPFFLKEAAEVLPEGAMAKALAEEQKRPDHQALAAIAAGAEGASVIGYGAIWKEPGLRMQHDCVVFMSLLKAHWGIGIGRAFWERFERWARERGARRLTTTLLGHNARGLRFAERQGFAVEVASPRFALKDGRPVARVRLGKRLG
jgi:GNAT superfamily N-acetyltransferase